MRDELEKIADQALHGEDWPGRIARARRSRRQRWLLTTLSVVAAIAVPSIVLTSSDRAAPSSVTVGPSAPSTSALPGAARPGSPPSDDEGMHYDDQFARGAR